MEEALFFDKLQKKRKKLASQLKDPAAAGFWDLLVDKYSDQVHFIYELLQNSDDANAQNVRIFLYPDHLEYLHDGDISFTISDPEKEEYEEKKGHLNAITSVGASSKKEEEKIGKFGIGFKSVFQYTSTPHIEDDQISFDIVDYIVPEKRERKQSQRQKGETLFYLPFKDPATAYKEIEEKLLSLHLPTLFLRKINYIKWESKELQGEFGCKKLKEATFNGNYYYFKEFFQNTNGSSNKTYIHLFAEKISTIEQLLQVAFIARQDGGPIPLASTQNWYCFFETKTNSGLPFFLHAPFSLTSNREGLKEMNEWNEWLQEQLVVLVGNSLEFLCQKEEIGDEILNFLPLQTTKRSQPHPFQHFHEQLLRKIKRLPIFRTLSGLYLSSTETIYTEFDEIRQLFNRQQLAEINKEYIDWCFCSINHNDTIATLIHNRLLAKHITFLEIAEQITPDFLQKQSIDWLIQFYSTAHKFPESWQGRASTFKTQPFLLGADNQFYSLYSAGSETPQLYLTNGISNRFNALHPQVLQSEKCQRFFKNLGITSPGKLAEILLYMLPYYQNGEINIDEREKIGTDIMEILHCYESSAPYSNERKQLIEQLQKTTLFPAYTIGNQKALKQACDCCLETTELKSFASHNEHVYFLDNSFIIGYIAPEKRDCFYQILSELGLHFGLMVEEKQVVATSSILEKLSLKPISLRQYDKGAQIIKDKEIVGFESFLAHITPQSSAAFFHILKKEIEKQSSYLFRLSLQGDYQYIEKGKKHYTQEIITSTSAIQSIFKSRWIYNKEEKLCTPQEINDSSELSEIYDISATDLLFFLGIKLSSEISNLTQSQREAIAIVNKFRSNGISISMMEKILTEIIEKKR
jgi:hypothetical protein